MFVDSKLKLLGTGEPVTALFTARVRNPRGENTMNILLINHYAGSKVHGMEYRPFYLAREWVRAGHQVTIAAASYCHYRSETMPMEGNVQEEHIEGIRYVWLKTPRYEGNGFKRILNMMTFLMQLSARTGKLVETGKPELVIASSTYCLDILPAYRIARRYGAKLVFDVRDLWPLTPVILGEMPRWHPYIFTLQMAEDFAYRNSDVVVSVLKKSDSYMQSRGMDQQKFVFIPNGVDPEEWRDTQMDLPLQHRRELARLRNEGRFMIGYAGSHGLANALDTFIEAAALVADEPVALVLVGQGPDREDLQAKASEAGLTNVVFLPAVPRQAVPRLLDSMDALYIGWRKEPLYRFGIGANKLLDYMMAGKPVIHSTDSGHDIVAESGGGISVPPERPSEVAEAIVRLLHMSDRERAEMGARGRAHVLTHHDYRLLARRFLQAVSLS